MATGIVSGVNYVYTITLIWLLSPGQYVVTGSISALLLISGSVAGASIPWVLARKVAAPGKDADRRARTMSFATGATVVQAAAAGVATCLVA